MKFWELGEIGKDNIEIVVVALRCQGKWLMCREPSEDTWRFLQEKRNDRESPEDAAMRCIADWHGVELNPVKVFETEEESGMLFFASAEACISERLNPEYLLVDVIPQDWKLSERQVDLFHCVQGWLNLQSKSDEIWDVYDEKRNLTGRFQRRGDPTKPGDYHLGVHIWIINSHGEFLLTKRSPNKGYPNLWESTGGSAVAGDDSMTAALREVEEETGLVLNPAAGRLILQYTGKAQHTDVWLFQQEYDLDAVILQDGETCDKRKATREEILALRENGLFVPDSYLETIMNIIKECMV